MIYLNENVKILLSFFASVIKTYLWSILKTSYIHFIILNTLVPTAHYDIMVFSPHHTQINISSK